MKTIKVFLASSEELEDERLKLNQAIIELNKNIYNKKDVNIDLFMWEMHDRQCRTEAKQEEYNKHVRESDMFLGLFWTKAGKFTLEEFNVAHKQYEDTQKAPALFVFFKEVEQDKEDLTLKEFKARLQKVLTHYPSKFCSVEQVKYEFLEEFLRLEINGAFGGIRVVDGMVMYDDYAVCEINALPFAANNIDRTELVETIEKLRARIEKLTSKAEDEDDWADIRAKKVELELNEKELEQHDEALIRMSVDYARRASSESSATLLEAREAFRQGKMQKVRELTKVSDIDKRIEAKREYNKALSDDFELLLISRNAIIADISIPIEQRIVEVSEVYERLRVLLNELNKEESLYAEIIFDYAQFANKYAKYAKAEKLLLELIGICEKMFGTEHPYTAKCYNNIGEVYKNLGNYSTALEYHEKSLSIRVKMLSTAHPDTATSYNEIGVVYYKQGDYPKALEYYKKALIIFEKVFGIEHLDTAASYNNIGMAYMGQGDYQKAVKCHKKALVIKEKTLGTEHSSTATSYNNIGSIYLKQGDYPKALEYYQKALVIFQKKLGLQHQYTKATQENIDYVKSLINK